MPRYSIITPAITNLGMVRSFDVIQFLLASPIPLYEGTQLPEILLKTFFSHSLLLLPRPNTEASDAGMFVEPVCRGLATDESWFYSRRQEIAVFQSVHTQTNRAGCKVGTGIFPWELKLTVLIVEPRLRMCGAISALLHAPFVVQRLIRRRDTFTFTGMVLWHIVKLPFIMTHSMAVSHYKFYMSYNSKVRKKLQWYGILGVSPHFVQSLHWPVILTTTTYCNFYGVSILQVYRHEDRF